MAGRKPKPTGLKVINGTFRSDRNSEAEPFPSGDLKDAPSHFAPEQVEIWDYAISNAPRGLLKCLDMSTLEVWVVACSIHRDAVKKVAKIGQVVKTPLGFPVVNPYLSNANKQAQIMLKAAAELGFTPSSRSRVSIADKDSKPKGFSRFVDPGL
jgi:P27 family predicted phage terminase small subunit